MIEWIMCDNVISLQISQENEKILEPSNNI